MHDAEVVMMRSPDDATPFSGLCFKIMTDPFVGSLTFCRIYSGESATRLSRTSCRTSTLCVRLCMRAERKLAGLQVHADNVHQRIEMGCRAWSSPVATCRRPRACQNCATIAALLPPPAGMMEAGTYVLNSNKGKKERIGRLMMMHANNREDIKVGG